jgi:hypothetical protein
VFAKHSVCVLKRGARVRQGMCDNSGDTLQLPTRSTSRHTAACAVVQRGGEASRGAKRGQGQRGRE